MGLLLYAEERIFISSGKNRALRRYIKNRKLKIATYKFLAVGLLE
jgi:hypothetical protein